ncbi:MAG: hypothetical protein ACRYG4_08550 [Janthinobacterium lividum]
MTVHKRLLDYPRAAMAGVVVGLLAMWSRQFWDVNYLRPGDHIGYFGNFAGAGIAFAFLAMWLARRFDRTAS